MSHLPPSVRFFVVLILLGLGVQFWIVLGDATLPTKRQLVLVVFAALAGLTLCVWPKTRGAALAALDRVRHPSPLARRLTAVALTILSGVYLLQTARAQERRYVPAIHDEYSYYLQVQQVAAGRLWMPKHELGDFFESFHILTDRVYASKYGPGTAILCAPAVWLGIPPWSAILVLSALCVGLTYLVVDGFVDGVAGLLAALSLPTLLVFRRLSVNVLSQTPMLFLFLVAIWAYLHWRRGLARNDGPAASAASSPPEKPRYAWFAVLSVAVGWAVVTRPVDAPALAIPLAVAILLDLRRAPRPVAARTLALGVLCVLPFLALQLVVNKGLTGRSTTLPWAYYAEKYDPFDTLGSPPPGTAMKSRSTLAQKQAFFDDFTVENYRAKSAKSWLRRLVADRVGPTVLLGVPQSLVLVFLPLGVVGALLHRRWLALGFLGIFFLLYNQYTYFVAHYVLVTSAAVLLVLFAGYDLFARGLPRPWEQPGRLVIALALFVLVVTGYPQLQRDPPDDEWQTTPLMLPVEKNLRKIGDAPAIVLFKFHPDANTHGEPVYNYTTAWPDDANIIRAHDLGAPKNQELFRYYAARQPDRRVYRYDRAPAAEEAPLTYLGTARELAATGH